MVCSFSSLQHMVQVEPRKGQWDMRQKQFHQGVEVHKWAIVVFTEEAHCDSDAIKLVHGKG